MTNKMVGISAVVSQCCMCMYVCESMWCVYVCVCVCACVYVRVYVYSYRYFTEFLMAHNREVALHVRREYVDTMGKVYYSYFKEYASKLMKLEVGNVCLCM